MLKNTLLQQQQQQLVKPMPKGQSLSIAPISIKLEMESMLEYKVFKKWDKEILDKHKKVMNSPSDTTG